MDNDPDLIATPVVTGCGIDFSASSEIVKNYTQELEMEFTRISVLSDGARVKNSRLINATVL